MPVCLHKGIKTLNGIQVELELFHSWNVTELFCQTSYVTSSNNNGGILDGIQLPGRPAFIHLIVLYRGVI